MADRRSFPPAELERLRRRTVGSLVAGVALGSTGHIAAVTVATIVATHIAGGTTALSGAPTATVVLGAAAGASSLSWLMVRRGRRVGLAAGYVVSVIGALIATVAVITSSLPILLVGTVLIGFGNSSNQLSRYVAADLATPDRRASAIGLVVWGATIGAVAGPNLAAPAGRVALALGLPELAGPYLVPIVFVGAAALLSFALLRPDPYELADASSRHDDGADRSVAVSLASVLDRPSVPVAMVALVAGQFVMVLIMTMTPLHMAEHGHDLAAVGIVISGHTFGMFGLSPISGRLTDRFGSVPVILAGLAVVALASVLAAIAPPSGGAVLFVALFLLGYGWNLGYVAGSALLTHGLSLSERTRIQGLTDTLIWSSAAVASLGSGFVLAYAGYAILGLMGAGLVVVPMLLVAARRSAVVG
ncbi:MAG TPA: MFS transporter [Candidatus Limnocylindrales bacterium]|nr:MFS transporter [Candidatus Limnocylindrales bacterium]